METRIRPIMRSSGAGGGGGVGIMSSPDPPISKKKNTPYMRNL